LIAEKIANSIATLLSVIPKGASREHAIAKLSGEREGLLSKPPENVNELLGIEGPASGVYFKALEGLTLNWKHTVRRPIPES
jgi:CRISPR/Cas system-associated endonuclease Cas1